jgi:hypothetical protein
VPLACLFGFTRLLEELLYTPKYSLIVQSLHSQLGAEETNETVQMTVATTEGDSVWGFLYSSAGKSRSLFYSIDVRTLRAQHPENPVLHKVSDESRLVVSEPLGDLAGAWNEVPESSFGVIQEGQDQLMPFTPGAPKSSAPLTRATSAAGSN